MRWLAVVAVLLISGCTGAPQQPSNVQRPGLWAGIGLAVAAGFVAAESADDDDGPCVSFSDCEQP
jgi:hypothetical protein